MNRTPLSSITRRAFAGLVIATAMPPRLVAQSRLTVATVNYPLAYFAERIGGALVDVEFPVPDATDPSFWRPGISDIGLFQTADIILLNGAGFADWTARTTLPRSRIVRTSAAFEADFIATETITHSHGDGGAHSHTGVASYTWLDFAQAAQQAEAVATAMIRRMPEAEAEFARNLEALNVDLDGLDAMARRVGEGAAGVPVISSHPRYQYFARAYGLTMDAVEWDAVEPPSAEQKQALGALAGELGARVFIWEATPEASLAAEVEALGLASVVFPPLANRPAEGDFLTSMLASLSNLEEAFDVVTDG